MKEEFLEFVKKLMANDPTYSDSIITDNVKMYMNALENGDTMADKPLITDNGKVIIKYMKTLTVPMKSADIAVGMGMASRSVSGTMRKLVSDGFVEKIGDKSALYIITTKGKELEID